MNGDFFADSNLLVYARDASEPLKQPRALAWIQALWDGRRGRLSTQILNEFYVTVTTKLKPGMPAEEAWRDVQAFYAWKPVVIRPADLDRARTVQERYSFSWWDSLVVSAAVGAECAVLLTEDLQDGQVLDGLTVVNPFRHEPTEVMSG